MKIPHRWSCLWGRHRLVWDSLDPDTRVLRCLECLRVFPLHLTPGCPTRVAVRGCGRWTVTEHAVLALVMLAWIVAWVGVIAFTVIGWALVGRMLWGR
jgi:hypothetical protein